MNLKKLKWLEYFESNSNLTSEDISFKVFLPDSATPEIVITVNVFDEGIVWEDRIPCQRIILERLLKKLQLSGWEKSYEYNGKIFFGTSWRLELAYKDWALPERYTGRGIFPPNYDLLHDFFFSLVPERIFEEYFIGKKPERSTLMIIQSLIED